MAAAPGTTGVTGALTDGTGVSSLTVPKVIKDAILDFLLGLPGVFIAINVANLEAAVAAPVAVAFGIGDVLVRVVYRTALKWAQSP